MRGCVLPAQAMQVKRLPQHNCTRLLCCGCVLWLRGWQGVTRQPPLCCRCCWCCLLVLEVLLVVEVGWGENSYVTSRPLPLFGVWCGLAIGLLGFRDGSRLSALGPGGTPGRSAKTSVSLS